MADLSKFTPEERAFIASVPYRVAVWVANVDDNTGSKIDEREERKALEAAISNLAAKSAKIPFAATIMKSVEQNKSAWPAWEGKADEQTVLADTKNALTLCKDKMGGKAVSQYKQTIWKLAMVVAQAYGEHIDPDNEMHVDRFFQWIGSLSGGAKLGKNPENISKNEKIALNKLRAILKE